VKNRALKEEDAHTQILSMWTSTNLIQFYTSSAITFLLKLIRVLKQRTKLGKTN